MFQVKIEKELFVLLRSKPHLQHLRVGTIASTIPENDGRHGESVARILSLNL